MEDEDTAALHLICYPEPIVKVICHFMDDIDFGVQVYQNRLDQVLILDSPLDCSIPIAR